MEEGTGEHHTQHRQEPEDENILKAPSDSAASSGGAQSSAGIGSSEHLSTGPVSEYTSVHIHRDEEGATDSDVSKEASFATQNKQKMAVDEGKEKGNETTISREEDDESIGCVSSSEEEELLENATSLETSSGPSSDQIQSTEDNFDMSSLTSSLPVKRGLSKYYDGKSDSFKSFTNLTRVEELAKPARPDKKRGSPSGRLQDFENPPSPGKSPRIKK